MGRPPLGERALTPAEKMRRYRERKFGNKPPVTKQRHAELEQAKARIAGLERENAQLRESLAAAEARARRDARRSRRPSVRSWKRRGRRSRASRPGYGICGSSCSL
jgi:hypothetical protein